MFGSFLYFAVDSINTPIINIAKPVHRLILIFSDREYNSVSPKVVKPKMVKRMPRIVNNNPIGIFISSFIAFIFYHQYIVSAIAIMPTITASISGFLNQGTPSSFILGVRV